MFEIFSLLDQEIKEGYNLEVENLIRNKIGKLYTYEIRLVLSKHGKKLSESFLREIRDWLNADEYIVTYCHISDDFARELGCIEKDTKWVK